MGNRISDRRKFNIDQNGHNILEKQLRSCILLCGDTKAGKTWITRSLCQLLKIYYDDIEYGEHIMTKGIDVYLSITQVRRNNVMSRVCIMDTEGLNKAETKGNSEEHCVLNELILSAIQNISGIVVYVTSEYRENDEIMIKTLSSLIKPDKRIIIIHNKKDGHLKKIGDLKENLKAYKNLVVTEEDGILKTRWNGHEIEHYMLLQKDMYKGFNETVLGQLIELAETQKEVDVASIGDAISASHRKKLMSEYEFCYNVYRLGEIRINYRKVFDVEIKEMSADPINDRAIDVSGSFLNYNKLAIKSIKRRGWDNLYEAMIYHRDGFFELFQIWLPDIVMKFGHIRIYQGQATVICTVRNITYTVNFSPINDQPTNISAVLPLNVISPTINDDLSPENKGVEDPFKDDTLDDSDQKYD
jgi:GTPase SAR1 family protein